MPRTIIAIVCALVVSSIGSSFGQTAGGIPMQPQAADGKGVPLIPQDLGDPTLQSQVPAKANEGIDPRLKQPPVPSSAADRATDAKNAAKNARKN